MYGMLQAALLWYKKFCKDLEVKGFKFNPYDPCMVNQTRKGKQHTVLFHVNDLKSSHKDPRVNDKFEKWLQQKYGHHGKVKVHQGKKHDYLSMIIDYSEKGKVKFDMSDYVKDMIKEFPEVLKPMDIVATPASDSLFNHGQGKKLTKRESRDVPYNGSKRTICIKESKTGYSSNDFCPVYKSERSE